MEIDNVRKEDAGTYICTASNNVGTISADQIELKVLCKIYILGDRSFFSLRQVDSILDRAFTSSSY